MKSQEAEPKKALVSQSNSLQKQIAPLPWTPTEKSQLAVVIGQVFDMQKQYGKTTGQLETLIKGFCWALSQYPAAQVIEGFQKYVITKSDMPTPCDIRNIIDPQPPTWMPDKAYYVNLKKIREEHGPFGLDQDEIEYIAKYENHVLRASSR